VITEII